MIIVFLLYPAILTRVKKRIGEGFLKQLDSTIQLAWGTSFRCAHFNKIPNGLRPLLSYSHKHTSFCPTWNEREKIGRNNPNRTNWRANDQSNLIGWQQSERDSLLHPSICFCWWRSTLNDMLDVRNDAFPFRKWLDCQESLLIDLVC